MADDKPLTPKQQRFVEEYLVDLNAAAAARRAGYSEAAARDIGAENLTKPNILAAIEAAKAARSRRTEVTADRVLLELARVGFSDIGEVLNFSGTDLSLRPAAEIPEDARRAIASIKVRRSVLGSGDEAREVEVVEFRLHDKLSALEKAGKHIGMWPNKLDLSGTVRHEGEVVPDDVRLAALDRLYAAVRARAGEAVVGPGPAPADGPLLS